VSRRYQELEERASHGVNAAKAVLKRLESRERVHVTSWLCKYYDDAGTLFSSQFVEEPAADRARWSRVLAGEGAEEMTAAKGADGCARR